MSICICDICLLLCGPSHVVYPGQSLESWTEPGRRDLGWRGSRRLASRRTSPKKSKNMSLVFDPRKWSSDDFPELMYLIWCRNRVSGLVWKSNQRAELGYKVKKLVERVWCHSISPWFHEYRSRWLHDFVPNTDTHDCLTPSNQWCFLQTYIVLGHCQWQKTWNNRITRGQTWLSMGVSNKSLLFEFKPSKHFRNHAMLTVMQASDCIPPGLSQVQPVEEHFKAKRTKKMRNCRIFFGPQKAYMIMYVPHLTWLGLRSTNKQWHLMKCFCYKLQGAPFFLLYVIDAFQDVSGLQCKETVASRKHHRKRFQRRKKICSRREQSH